MREAVDVPVTVKCRIGVDDQVPRDILPDFLEKIQAVGCERVTIHARMAWLQGLSPKENRDIPPLDYDLVFEMKQAFPDLHISLNGGVQDLDTAVELLERGLDGVMIGRSAYHTPSDILLAADQRVYNVVSPVKTPHDIVHEMLPYIEAHLAEGGRVNQITRHMLGLFAGRPGARQWRRHLSETAHKAGAGTEIILAALDQIPQTIEGA